MALAIGYIMPTETSRHYAASQWQRYLLQAIFIFITVLLSLLAAGWVLQQVFVKKALALEAESFITSRAENPAFPLPRTRNLVGYVRGDTFSEEIPRELLVLEPGLHVSISFADQEKASPVYVEDFDEGRLYLIFAGYNVDRLVGIFGLIPIGLLLIGFYGASWVAYRFSERAISPVLRIARRLRETSPEQDRLEMPIQSLKGEAKELAIAVDDYARRMDDMVERERQFSADVSHELRTPITIIDGATQFLQTEQGLSEKGHQRAQMIRRACKDISELIDAFLILGREPTLLNASDAVDVAAIAQTELVKVSSLIHAKDIEMTLDKVGELHVPVNRKVFEIIINNLCRNAIKHTESGKINIIVTDTELRVEDCGSGVDEELLPHIFDRHVRGKGQKRAGEGIGLSIVKRLCDMYGWDISIANREQASGVVVTVRIA